MSASAVLLGPSASVSAIRPPFPYPGLRPFDPEESSIFFGREQMIADIIERLAEQRFVLIHGASGSGKSSLVRAGVLPKLARQHLRHGTPWLTCAMRPSGGPLWNLAAEFARLEGRGDDLARRSEIIRLFNRSGATLSGVAAQLAGVEGKRLCLLVDQFEELFRFERESSREEAELFIELLIGEIPQAQDAEADPASDGIAGDEPARPAVDLHIILTMRSEFLGDCARFNGFAEAVNRTQYLVPRLTRAALMRAIRQPARLFGGEVTEELAERLIADARGKLDELPLIQHGLMLFWYAASRAEPGAKIVLDAPMLDRAGGLAQLLSDHADEIMRNAAPSEPLKRAVEQLFRALTDINAEGQAIRRPVSFGTLVKLCGVPADALGAILDAFRAEGVSFVTPYAPAPITEKTIIDISHEALIRCWWAIADPKDGWLRREFDDGLVWRSLLMEAREFENDNRRVLSTATTVERQKWMADRTASWSERYGGDWLLVNRLLRASRKAVVRKRHYWRLFIVSILCLAAFGATGAFDNYESLPIAIGILLGATFFEMLLVEILMIDLAILIVNLCRRAFTGVAALVRRAFRSRRSAIGHTHYARVGGFRFWRLQRFGQTLRRRWYIAVFGSVLVALDLIIVTDPSFQMEQAATALGRNDYARALALYREAARGGYAAAQNKIGDLYYLGTGVPRDYVQAMAWYREAADQGYTDAETNIGVLYHFGLGGTQDYSLAMDWYRKAAEQGNTAAQNNIGTLYENGQGVPQDYTQAMTWYRKAAEGGAATAMYHIGTLYENGLGVPKDPQQALEWMRKAADGGEKRAKDWLAAQPPPHS